jgi:hypothetical protein
VEAVAGQRVGDDAGGLTLKDGDDDTTDPWVKPHVPQQRHEATRQHAAARADQPAANQPAATAATTAATAKAAQSAGSDDVLHPAADVGQQLVAGAEGV